MFFCVSVGAGRGENRGVTESRKKFYFYLEQSSLGDKVLILAFQTGSSCQSEGPLTDIMSWAK